MSVTPSSVSILIPAGGTSPAYQLRFHAAEHLRIVTLSFDCPSTGKSFRAVTIGEIHGAEATNPLLRLTAPLGLDVIRELIGIIERREHLKPPSPQPSPEVPQ